MKVDRSKIRLGTKMDAADLIIQQIKESLPECWLVVNLHRFDFDPPRDTKGYPLVSSAAFGGPTNLPKMDRFVIQVDGFTYLDAEILPSSHPKNWTGYLRILSNSATEHRYPEDEYLDRFNSGTNDDGF